MQSTVIERYLHVLGPWQKGANRYRRPCVERGRMWPEHRERLAVVSPGDRSYHIGWE